MKKLFSTIFASAFMLTSFACSSSSAGSETPTVPEPEEEVVKETIRVMAYNIHHANPPSKPDFIDIDAIVSAIRNENPDIVALQEVDADTERSGPGNQAAIIAEKLGMEYVFGKGIDYEGGEYGVAILSKFPIEADQLHRLPTQSGTNGEPRVLLTAKITTPGGTAIRFGSTHLDAQSANTNRLLQINKIVELAQDESLPFIVAGDFNAKPESEVIRILESHFDRTCRLCPFTISAANPTKAIDFIAFHHPDGKFEARDHKSVNESYASDHLPIVANIDILE